MERIKNSAISARAVTITVDGKRIRAHENETVGMSILAAGRRALARSIKFHRPRSMFCSTGTCQRCLMEIDGIPNRRACVTPVKDGMVVRSQNSFPNAENDVFAFIDKFSNHLHTSIYHHHFLKPKFLRQTYLKILKRFTGLGRLDLNQPALARRETGARRTLPDLKSAIVIAGGGLTGLSAALAAADAGASVLVLEQTKLPYGRLTAGQHADPLDDGFAQYQSRLDDFETRVKTHAAVTLWPGAILTGIYEGRRLGVVSPGDGIADLQPTSLIIATGAYDALPVFKNNDLPGIFSARLVEKMIHVYGIKPGRRALIWGAGRPARSVARALIRAKTRIAGFVTGSATVSSALSSMARDQKTEVWTDSVIFDVNGKRQINSTVIRNTKTGELTAVKNDVIAVCHLQPRYELQLHAGCEMIFDEQRGGLVARTDAMLRSTRSRVYVAGEALGGEKGQDLCIAEGALAGYVAARDLGYSGDGAQEADRIAAVKKCARQKATEPIWFDSPKGEGYVCFCQDVKARELLAEIEKLGKELLDGFHTELVKRRIGILTGPCQGKSCLCNFLRILAHAEDKKPLDFPIPTVRPPLAPVSINDMAAGNDNDEKDL